VFEIFFKNPKLINYFLKIKYFNALTRKFHKTYHLRYLKILLEHLLHSQTIPFNSKYKIYLIKYTTILLSIFIIINIDHKVKNIYNNALKLYN